MAARVLLIESARANVTTFAPALEKKGYSVHVTHSGKAAIQVASRKGADVIILDAASMRTSGNRICAQLRRHFEDMPIIHVKAASENGAPSPANIVLYMDFTPRKLINRIERFLNANKGEVLIQGEFKLNIQQRLLTARDKETRLTPKLAKLMEEFMRKPGETLDRKYLMKTVWDTEYMGDTRTLDVHIRWIRDAVELGDGKPQFILTERGKGYRFEPNGHSPDRNA
ncbi:MAG: response regulator transcription factor [Anaerolineae bacterium]|nr:response regulator transcription factor [Anaerolineae bacterium]